MNGRCVSLYICFPASEDVTFLHHFVIIGQQSRFGVLLPSPVVCTFTMVLSKQTALPLVLSLPPRVAAYYVGTAVFWIDVTWRMYAPTEYYCETDWKHQYETPESQLQAHKACWGGEGERERVHTYNSTPWQITFAALPTIRLIHTEHIPW